MLMLGLPSILPLSLALVSQVFLLIFQNWFVQNFFSRIRLIICCLVPILAMNISDKTWNGIQVFLLELHLIQTSRTLRFWAALAPESDAHIRSCDKAGWVGWEGRGLPQRSTKQPLLWVEYDSQLSPVVNRLSYSALLQRLLLSFFNLQSSNIGSKGLSTRLWKFAVKVTLLGLSSMTIVRMPRVVVSHEAEVGLPQ